MRLVPSWPLVGKELIEQSARKRTYVTRVVYAALLFSLFSLIYAQLLRVREFNPLYILGTGEQLFEAIVILQFIGVFIFLPAMMSGAIAQEKERQSMALLLLTGLGPMNILMEKFIGRLIPMVTFLLLSLPLLAVAYMLGGVSADAIGAAVFMLLLTCLQVGAFALFMSAWCRTSVSAFVATYVWGFAFYLGPPLLAEMVNEAVPGRWIDEDVAFGLVPPFVYAVSLRSGFDEMAARSIPAWATVVLFLWLARRVLVRRAFLPPTSRVLQGFRRLDGVMKEWNRQFGGIVLGKGGESLPESEPVTWRETTQRLLGRANYLARLGILIEVPVLLLAIYLLNESGSGWGQSEEFSAAAVTIWCVAALAIVVHSGNTIASERSRGTLEVLATTPLEGTDILRQKMRAVRRMMFVFAVPLMTIVAFEAWWEWAVQRERGYDSEPEPMTYVLGTAATVAVYLPMLAWGSLWVSLRSRSRARAVVTAVTALAIWLAAAPFFVGVLGSFDVIDGNDTITLVMLMFSPASMVLVMEFWGFEWFDMPAVLAIAMNTAIYGACWAGFRHLCLTNADRYLGRADSLTASAASA